ncbi:MAG: histidine kinase [Saprospiraceae bacterium]|nr:histidine kinase [Saprospiraceae bacterium]
MKCLVLIVLCLSPGQLSGQQPFFRQYEVPEEIAETPMDILYQANSDFIWLGGEQGLLQFDGFSFEPFLRNDTIGENKVTSIFRDQDHLLWVGYTDGQIFQLQLDNVLQLWEPEEGLPKVPISGFSQDKNGILWIATYGEGLYYWNGQRMYNVGLDDGLGGQDIYSIAQDQEGRIWVGTDNGISVCWLEEGKKKIKNIGRPEGLPDDIIRYILPDPAGHYWVGTYEKGFCRINGESLQVDFVYPDWEQGVINCMELVEGRALWIGTTSKGVWRYDFQSEHLQSIPLNHLQKDRISALHTDHEGNLWVLGREAGLLSINCHFTLIDNNLQNLQAIHLDQKDRLWVGSQDGLYQWTNAQKEAGSFEKILNENILSLFEDSVGNIWAGTFGKGVILINPNTGKQRRLDEKDGLPNGSILSIDGTGELIWLATLGGVVELRCRKDPMREVDFKIKMLDHESALGTNFIYKVFVDQGGRTWFGTDGKGIALLEDGALTSYQETGTAPIRSVYSITEDNTGKIWFSTLRDGIYSFDGQNFKHFGKAEGLRNLSIRGLVKDKNGDLLILHPGGIDRLDPETEQLMYFGKSAGIGDIDPNLNTYAYDHRGDIWIGTDNRIIKYTALSNQLARSPTTTLKKVAVNFTQIACSTTPCLTYDENNLIFEYVGLWYSDPDAVRYRYKLEGYNQDWIYSKDNQATFPSLPHGKYTFLVTSSENGIFLADNTLSYDFIITSPIWKRSWFVVLGLALLAGLIYSWMRSRERRMQREAALVKEKLESQFETLKSQINPHFLFNNFNTLITIIEENPTIAVEYVEKLSDFYRSILQYREQETIPLNEELKIVKDYTFLLKKRFGENFKMSIEVKDMNKANVVPLTLQMLVENAIKHNVISKHDPLTVRVVQEDTGYITICNNLQKKIVAEHSTGFGLESIVKRYGLLTTKKVLIREERNQFKVSIPLMSNPKS